MHKTTDVIEMMPVSPVSATLFALAADLQQRILDACYPPCLMQPAERMAAFELMANRAECQVDRQQVLR